MEHKFQFDEATITFRSSPEDAELIIRTFNELKGKICFSNSDFVDDFDAQTIKYILENSGTLTFSTAQASGEDRVREAAREAVKNIHCAKTLIAEFVTDQYVTLDELTSAAEIIEELQQCSGLFAWGHVVNSSEICEVNIIAV